MTLTHKYMTSNTQIHDPYTQIHDPYTQIHDPNTQIHDPNTQIHDGSLSWLGTNTSIKTALTHP